MKSTVIKVIGAGGFFTFLTGSHRPLVPPFQRMLTYRGLAGPHGLCLSHRVKLSKSSVALVWPNPCLSPAWR